MLSLVVMRRCSFIASEVSLSHDNTLCLNNSSLSLEEEVKVDSVRVLFSAGPSLKLGSF